MLAVTFTRTHSFFSRPKRGSNNHFFRWQDRGLGSRDASPSQRSERPPGPRTCIRVPPNPKTTTRCRILTPPQVRALMRPPKSRPLSRSLDRTQVCTRSPCVPETRAVPALSEHRKTRISTESIHPRPPVPDTDFSNLHSAVVPSAPKYCYVLLSRPSVRAKHAHGRQGSRERLRDSREGKGRPTK